MASAQIARVGRRSFVHVAVLTFGASLVAAVAGCAGSDEFDFKKSERQMSRAGQYGSGLTDAERIEMQENYAKKQEAQKSANGGG